MISLAKRLSEDTRQRPLKLASFPLLDLFPLFHLQCGDRVERAHAVAGSLQVASHSLPKRRRGMFGVVTNDFRLHQANISAQKNYDDLAAKFAIAWPKGDRETYRAYNRAKRLCQVLVPGQ